MEALWRDLRFACRTLVKNPGFAVVAIFVLALGIGANTAIFSVFDAILLRPLPYPQPERLVAIFGTRPKDNVFRGWTSPLNLLDLESQSRCFESLAAMQEAGATLLGAGEAETLQGWAVSREFFTVLRTRPLLGHPFSAEEDRPGGPGVIILSHAFWRGHFGADPGAIGRKVTLDGAPATIVGVMPAGFDFPASSTFWKPLQLNPGENGRGSHFLSLLARLAPGRGVSGAQACCSATGASACWWRSLPRAFPG